MKYTRQTRYKTKILVYIITGFDTLSPIHFHDLIEFLRIRSSREEILF